MSIKGTLLETLTWIEAEKVLRNNPVIVIPLGASAKEHGPHLPLNNDWLLAEYLKTRVLEKLPVVMAPTLNFHYYPAFLEYPGSISLTFETARNLIIDICHSLSPFGPNRFYVLNTGISTLKPLAAAKDTLASAELFLHYTDIEKATQSIESTLIQQERGGHADEVETSMMLYIAPEIVDMGLAIKDMSNYQGHLTRDPNKKGTYSPSGIWGDPTLATREKGQRFVEALVQAILEDIYTLETISYR